MDLHANAAHRREQVDPPEIVQSVYLENQWVIPLCSWSAAIQLRRLMCTRCDVAQQCIMMSEQPTCCYLVPFPAWFLLALLADVVTAGAPCGCCYLGCGTALVGCWTRWLVRRKYRIKGFGYRDCGTWVCCPACAMQQQALEMGVNGVPEPPLCGLMC